MARRDMTCAMIHRTPGVGRMPSPDPSPHHIVRGNASQRRSLTLRTSTTSPLALRNTSEDAIRISCGDELFINIRSRGKGGEKRSYAKHLHHLQRVSVR